MFIVAAVVVFYLLLLLLKFTLKIAEKGMPSRLKSKARCVGAAFRLLLLLLLLFIIWPDINGSEQNSPI